MGAVVAAFLGRQGYALVLNARGETLLRQIAEVAQTAGAEVQSVVGDVADEDTRRALQEAVGRLERLDLLLNNASALGPSPLPPLVAYPVDELRRVLEVNLVAPLALVQELLPWLRASHGLVVNISSDAARGGYPGWGGYGSSKAALDLVSLTLAEELREDDVAVVSVDPGDLRTGMQQRAFPGEDISDRPRPDVTLPFWAWLLGEDPRAISGQRFEAQSERWEVLREAV